MDFVSADNVLVGLGQSSGEAFSVLPEGVLGGAGHPEGNSFQTKPQGLNIKLYGNLKEAKQNSVKERIHCKALWKGMTDERNR